MTSNEAMLATATLGSAWLAAFPVGIIVVITACKAHEPVSAEVTVGGMGSISLLAVPSLAARPTSIVQHFSVMYRIGFYTHPPATALLSILFCIPAYRQYRSGGDRQWQQTACAGLALFSVLPFTFALLERTSQQILNLEAGTAPTTIDDGSGGTAGQASRLIKRWAALNGIRSLFPLIAAAIGMRAML